MVHAGDTYHFRPKSHSIGGDPIWSHRENATSSDIAVDMMVRGLHRNNDSLDTTDHGIDRSRWRRWGHDTGP